MRFSRPVVVLDAPTNLGLKPPASRHEPGVRRLPDALRARRLLARLEAGDGGRVAAPPYRFGIDRATGIRNTEGLLRFAAELADALEPMLARGDFPLVLGGDCSLLLGSALALRRGLFGLCSSTGIRIC
jgi:arginase